MYGIYGWGKSLLASETVLQICLQITCVMCVCKCVGVSVCVCKLACVELGGNSRQWEECWFYSCVSAITRSLRLKAIGNKKKIWAPRCYAHQPKSPAPWPKLKTMVRGPHELLSTGLAYQLYKLGGGETVCKQDGSCSQFLSIFLLDKLPLQWQPCQTGQKKSSDTWLLRHQWVSLANAPGLGVWGVDYLVAPREAVTTQVA